MTSSCSWSTTSQNGGYAYINFNGKTATMTLGPGAYRVITCQVTTETCGVASISFTGYNFGSSFMVAAYPNPADETLTVSIRPNNDEHFSLTDNEAFTSVLESQFENASVKLLNEGGESVAAGTLSSKTCILDVSNIPVGLYFLHIDTPKEKIREQIVIRR